MKTRSRSIVPPFLMAALLTSGVLSIASVAALEAQVWVPKGPSPGVGGGTTNIGDNPIGGALETVVAHPTNANVLWVGSVNGGVFRTDNATSSNPHWTPQTDSLGSLSIGALELDPTDGTHDTLVAGIGRTSAFAGVGGALTGLLKTTDGGSTWTSLPYLANGNITGVAPRGSTIVAALDAPVDCDALGIWRSTDGGNTFSHLSNSAVLPCGFALDLASDPTNSARLFAPSTGTGELGDGLYRSTDTGATWIEVGGGSVLDGALTSGPDEVQVVVGKGGGANANVFVAVCQTDKLTGLFYSGNAGDTWVSLDLPTTTELGTPYGIHPGGQCGIHLSLVADPNDHSVVYIGGDRQPANNENGSPGDTFPNSIGASGYHGRLFRVDADLPSGSQATPITNCGTALPACGGLARTANDTAPHADSREMVFDALGHIIQTDDGGVYRHTNPSGATGDWVSVVGDLRAVEQHDSDYDTVSDILISGNQDNGTTEQLTPGNNRWETIGGGDGGDVVVAENDPAGQSTRYLSAQNLGGARRLTFDANNVFQGFSFLSLTPLTGFPAVSPQFVTPLAVNAADPTRLILGAANGVYESLDRLDSVARISLSTVNPGGRGPIAYGIPSDADVLYYGTDWEVHARIGAPLTAYWPGEGSFDFDSITDVVIDPDNASHAFAVDISSVYRTENAGPTWFDVTGNLFSANSAGEINAVEYINSGGDRLVVGTDTGVFVATEASGFSSWTALGTGLPNALVYDLVYDPENDVLAAGTMGRGSWTLSLDATCPWERAFLDTTLGTPQTQKADGIIYLGPDLTVNASGVNMVAGEEIAVGEKTSIGGTFSASLGPCP